jgi:hypothetical protein
VTGTAPSAGTEGITRDELAEALRGLKITPEDENTYYPAVADAIFDEVRRNREPEYEPGAVYADGCGLPLRYTVSGGWEAFGRAGEHTYDFPLRPLRKLVPEGSQAAAIDGLDGEALVELLERAGLSQEMTNTIARDIHYLMTGDRP